uniref:Multidrug and toxic compound extrusion protein n=1 Tax=Timspurckia oligopyrenoides TaxID=708627 RepID=A0A7S1EUB0_9RHOD
MEVSMNWMDHLWDLIVLGTPVLIASISQGSLMLVSMIYAGRMDTDSLAGIALGCSIVNISGISVHMGLATALDTLCSQAYGAGNYPMLGIWLQRGVFLGTIISFLIAFVWYFLSNSILNALQIAPEVAVHSTQFLQTSVWMIWPLMTQECTKRYLQAQSQLKAVLWSSFLGTVSNFIICWLFIDYLELDGVLSIAISLSISYWIMLASIILFSIIFEHHADTWVEISWININSGWKEYLSLGFPAVVHCVMEWAAFEVTLIESAMLGSTSLAAQGILLNFCSVMFLLPFSISIALSIRVGQLLGAQKHRAAKQLTFLSLIFSEFCLIIPVAVLMGLFPYFWARIYVDSKVLLERIVAVSKIFSMYFLLDSIQIVCTGALKGAGLQSVAAVGALIGFWIVMVPLSYYLAFHTEMFHGIIGLWAGFVFGEIPLSIVYIGILWTRNWEFLANVAVERSIGDVIICESIQDEENNGYKYSETHPLLK